MSNVKKNFIYSIIQNIIISILPIITAPYVSRVLLADNIGIYSYTRTVAYCFSLISMIGINNYGNRTIAKVRDDKEKLSKTFFEIYLVQIICSSLSILFYILYLAFFVTNYQQIAFIQSIYLLSYFFSIEWFFQGLEKFKISSLVSIISKIMSTIFIFVFVKNPDDLWIYVLIVASFSFIEKALLILFLNKEIFLVKIKFSDIKKHIKPCLILFIPVISVGIYKQMDKLMLGILSSVTEVGYYEQAEKIISIPGTIITTFGLVMLPKISYLIEKNNKELISHYTKKVVTFTMFCIFPVVFGLIAISNDLIIVFLGNDFIKVATLINWLSGSMLFISFASVIRRQYLLPFEKDKIFIQSVMAGAIFNFLLNLVLIPKYSSVGTCISTLLAEFLVMLIQTMYAKKALPILDYFWSIFPFLYKSFIMFLIVLFVKNLNLSLVPKIFFQIIVGMFVYFLLNRKFILSLLSEKMKKKL